MQMGLQNKISKTSKSLLNLMLTLQVSFQIKHGNKAT